jgi:hypothetical protein
LKTKKLDLIGLNKLLFMKVFIITICAFCLASTLSAQEKSNTPKAKYKSGSSVVTVWENEAEGKYGTYTKLNPRAINGIESGH